MVFKTTCVDAENPLRESAFSFTRRTLFPPLDKRNTRDKAKGLSDHFGEVYRVAGRAMPCTLNRGRNSRQQALIEALQERACCYCGEGYGKGFAVGGRVGFRKGGYVCLYNRVVGATSRGNF